MKARIHFTTIQKRYNICFPKKLMQELGYGVGDKIVLKLSGNGIQIVKPNAFEEIDEFFAKMDVELKDLYKTFLNLK